MSEPQRPTSVAEPETPIRVAIVDDQELMRSALRMMVESQADLELAGEAADGHEALALVRTKRVDVVLMDLRMPRLDGIQATAAITSEKPATKVVALTTFDLDDYAFPAIRAGASGFLLKDARAEEIVEAIRTVHAGHAVVAPSTTRRLLEHVAAAPAADGGRAADIRARLTPRELDMLLELATGDSNAEIARRVHLSEATVKTHVGHVLAKLGLRDRVQAVVLAYEAGLVGRRT
ncbi:response regulator transcription factor [Nocardioides albus]|uniref:DNA-binding NarL/FixJ family response regulator n=1 Tax=Nocardioides albus TaxID=1841 RepID=A0A7W5F742_9ACTN|nr:response regulator transcription factor [Nocardioides albus]MBB3087611.1 DNA-binding NarL/FixJ family response regulator [Nocardioides albus]GGU10261.1 DNA-binding response regulator [Nocardioides albus]